MARARDTPGTGRQCLGQCRLVTMELDVFSLVAAALGLNMGIVNYVDVSTQYYEYGVSETTMAPGVGRQC